MINPTASFRVGACLLAFAISALSVGAARADTQGFAFKQAIAEGAAKDKDIAAFYKERDYESLWTGKGADKQRRKALVHALKRAEYHGLPDASGRVRDLLAQMEAARGPRARGLLEVAMSRSFLDISAELQSGVVNPKGLYDQMERRAATRTRGSYLANFAQSSPTAFFKALPPQSHTYKALTKHKVLLENVVDRGGWGPQVSLETLRPGDAGSQVVALRNRLMKMGYLARSTSATYDEKLTLAVRRFQAAHGLEQDGVAGPGTLGEVNVAARARLKSVLVAMERERWMNFDRGIRHIEVNLTDFTAKIIDAGKTTFQTRSVVGAKKDDRQSPEFSDEMEFMIVNPSWYVPRSIVTKEYLPKLQQDPTDANYIELTDDTGQVVDRTEIDFSEFTEATFPFSMRQPPSQSNALGLVKFMFPNKHNIYLHDTPAKRLFAREVRAFSHGCIRLADPFDFAYALLARQNDDPQAVFARALATGKEAQLNLEQHVPVHIIYRTAVISPKGEAEYRRDIYGRDAIVWQALRNAGVALRGVQG